MAAKSIEPHLQHLERTQLVRRLSEPDPAYAFKHVLIQEVVYESLLRHDRKKLHRAVGLALEGMFANRRDEIAPLLARHFLEGDEPGRAFEYFTRAGEAAARVFAHEEAILHFAGARDLTRVLTLDPEKVADVYRRLGREYELVGDYAQAVTTYEDLLARGRQAGDPRLELSALLAAATLHCTPTSYFDIEKGESITQRALVIAQSLDDKVAEAKILWQRTLLLEFSNRPAQAVAVGEQAVALARSLGLEEQLAFALNDIGSLYTGVGRIEDGLRAAAEAKGLWTKLGNLPMLTDILSNMAMMFGIRGETDKAQAASDEAYSISLRIGNLWGQSFSRMFIGFSYFDRGEVERALETMERSIADAERAGFMAPQVFLRGWLGMSHAYLGDVSEGIRLVRLSLERAAGHLPTWSWSGRAFLAEIHARNGNAGEARRVLQEVITAEMTDAPTWSFVFFPITLVQARVELGLGRPEPAADIARKLDDDLESAGILLFRPEALHLVGEALTALGRTEEAIRALGQARDLALRLENRRMLWEIDLDLARLLPEASPQRNDHLRSAREAVEFIAAHIGREPLKESFLSLPRVRQALGRA